MGTYTHSPTATGSYKELLPRRLLEEDHGGDLPPICTVSPTSVTASMEAPVFSSSSMTRIWFFLQAMCKGVKPFCSPPKRRQTHRRLQTSPRNAQTALLIKRQPLPKHVSDFPQTRKPITANH